MRYLLFYLLAIILPPVAVFICGTPSQVILNVFLWLFGCLPGVIHAIYVVAKHRASETNPTLRL